MAASFSCSRPTRRLPSLTCCRFVYVATAIPKSGELELYLGAKESRREWLLLATDSWPAWAAAHSDIHQLRARCANESRNDAP